MTEQEQMLRDDEERRRYLSIMETLRNTQDLMCAGLMMGNVIIGALDALCDKKLLEDESVKVTIGQINKAIEDVQKRSEKRVERVKNDLETWKKILERGSE